ncbi:hypothetical protein EJ04DRAFT_555350 [Polyplosphaeria fusca]|uniref:Uncharacterized protein n=1 Tax=Polyplosphaeria fusca TaxID=682080 RepID=A0A9P4QN87_9PLEO|nr:hypothetical protein EJ04DRAFT_555350 [Polyplosphaeria fusca]
MPPIPLHKDAPIHPTAQKPSGTTPQTADPPPTRTTPASIPAATTSSTSDPPPPQPGARPAAPTSSSHQPTSSTPAAPAPGPTATHITTETRLSGPPSQFSIPPPTDAQLAGRSTTTATTTAGAKPGPTTLDLGPAASAAQAEDVGGGVERRSLEHPPGYQQRADNTPYGTGVGGGAGDGQQREGGGGGGGGDGSVGDAAWGLLSKAGEALKKGEEAAWRAVRK